MTPELHRPLAADAVPAGGQDYEVVATEAECAALAARMQLPAIQALRCRFRLQPGLAGAVLAEGWLDARLVQTCVVTLEDFAATVAEHFSVRFVPAGAETDDIDPETIDEIPYSGGVLDLGEAAAEQLALALDPYPRAPDADLEQPSEPDDTPESPFARLAELRRRR
ncbi:MAG: DUF177 domain-containing protein [Alphaproteobacteria bacterium]|nr:DUF177 domain-containing protein [Alphaproteobacteria bacterium]